MNGIDRAWSRRPFVSPARWMPEAALSPLWTETTVTFSRSSPVPTPGGGFDRGGGASGIYLIAQCHVEVEEVTAPAAMQAAQSLVIAKWWTIYLPFVIDDVRLDPANYPRKGDRVRFTDDVGITRDYTLRAVTSPDTIADHFQIETEEFD